MGLNAAFRDSVVVLCARKAGWARHFARFLVVVLLQSQSYDFSTSRYQKEKTLGPLHRLRVASFDVPFLFPRMPERI